MHGWLLLLATLAQASGFRCDLSRLAAKPAVLLIGENHCHEGSKRVGRAVTGYAVDGTLAGAFEGLYPGKEAAVLKNSPWTLTPRSRFFGIENRFSHGLVYSYFASAMQRICEKSDAEVGDAALSMLSYNDYFADAWRQAKRRDPALSAGPAGALAERAEAGNAPRPDEIKALSRQDFARLNAILYAIHVEYVAMANARLSSLGLAASLTPSRTPGSGDSVERLIVPVRDREMADSIEDIYCASAEDGRMTVAVVGADHLPGLRRHLLEDSNNAVQVFTRRSDQQAEQLIADLARLAAWAYRPAGR